MIQVGDTKTLRNSGRIVEDDSKLGREDIIITWVNLRFI